MSYKLKEVLKAEKAPYLLTALFAIIVVQFNYTVATIFKVPIIEYEFKKEIHCKNGSFKQILMLRNISSDKLVTELHLQLRVEGDTSAKISNPDINPIPPASIIQDDPLFSYDKLLYYHIHVIQPGLSYQLVYFVNKPSFRPFMFFECRSPIKMEEKSLSTLFLSNHVLINFILMLIFIIVTVYYIGKYL